MLIDGLDLLDIFKRKDGAPIVTADRKQNAPHATCYTPATYFMGMQNKTPVCWVTSGSNAACPGTVLQAELFILYIGNQYIDSERVRMQALKPGT